MQTDIDCKVTVLMWLFVGIKRRSKVPGVMITQFIEELPEGKTTPDFTRKPIALTIQEGMAGCSENLFKIHQVSNWIIIDNHYGNTTSEKQFTTSPIAVYS